MQNLKIKKRDYIQSRLLTIVNGFLYKKSKEHIAAGYPNLAAFTFDHIGHSISLNGIYEKEELAIIKEWLTTNNLIRGAALDIGANIGNHSIFFSNMYKWVYSFEPHPLTLKALNLNVEMYSKNISIFPVGISNKEDSILFFLAKNSNMMGAKLIYNNAEKFNDDEVTTVKVLQLDRIQELANIEIGLIKIDVEGGELNVLSGGKETITKHKPVILFEQHLEDFNNGESKVIEYLKEFGYNFYIIRSNPIRSGSNSILKRFSNLCVELLMGRSYEIVPCHKFKPDFYNMIIAVYPAT